MTILYSIVSLHVSAHELPQLHGRSRSAQKHKPRSEGLPDGFAIYIQHMRADVNFLARQWRLAASDTQEQLVPWRGQYGAVLPKYMHLAGSAVETDGVMRPAEGFETKTVKANADNE